MVYVGMPSSPFLPFLIFGGLVLIVVGRAAWRFHVVPLLLSRRDIARVAKELVAQYGAEAAEMAFIEEHLAWQRCAPSEQGKWRRVRRALVQRGRVVRPENGNGA
ncbi:hypothetical protein [Pseudohoeflea coraliihabitans]|uniref:Uncharacterized protein n=1 Tax=Pseudohoeflea coraliihabitans TaxID=2860393 RepID=A0ABS6WKN3_9HYPH|nr:hypothetical protein [Pseudohoeflea sp. DP4N28-3]MBW3096213.1 hypothetical protein [Pseudohoeflea sp. DP4N28-3]